MMLTSPLARETTDRRNAKQVIHPAVLPISTPMHSRDMNRLLTAAVVNHKFCSLLLNDPLEAVAKGYNGETFELTAEEVQLLHAIKASSLCDFAKQLLTKNLGHEKGWPEAQSTVPLITLYAAA